MLSNKERFDWLAWSLHLLFGAVVGGVVGLTWCSGAFHHSRGMWAYPMLAFAFTAGCALFGGGLAAKQRDTLWFGRSAAAHKPTAPAPKRARVAMQVLLVVGGAAVLLSTIAYILK